MKNELTSMIIGLGFTLTLTLAAIYGFVSMNSTIDYVKTGDIVVYCPKDNSTLCKEGKVFEVDKRFIQIDTEIYKKSALRDKYVVRVLYRNR